MQKIKAADTIFSNGTHKRNSRDESTAENSISVQACCTPIREIRSAQSIKLRQEYKLKTISEIIISKAILPGIIIYESKKVIPVIKVTIVKTIRRRDVKYEVKKEISPRMNRESAKGRTDAFLNAISGI